MEKPKHWPDSYWNHISRNIGPITFVEQDKIKNSKVAILGTGGLGGPLAEHMVRAGCENMIICDNERFDESNLNRQICTRNDLGEFKINVLERHLKSINPNVKIKKYLEINPHNVNGIIKDVECVALTLDDPITSILIARACKRNDVPLLETWGIPYTWAWWFVKDNISYEDCYDLPTTMVSDENLVNMNASELNYKNKLLEKVFQFPGMKETYNREFESTNFMLNGQITLRSFSPFIRMSAAYLCVEMIFAGILEIKQKVLAPKIIGYDYLRNQLINFKIKTDLN